MKHQGQNEKAKYGRVVFSTGDGRFVLQFLNNKTEFKVVGDDGRELKLNDRSQRQFLTRLLEHLLSEGGMTNNEIGKEILKHVGGKTEIEIKGFDLFL